MNRPCSRPSSPPKLQHLVLALLVALTLGSCSDRGSSEPSGEDHPGESDSGLTPIHAEGASSIEELTTRSDIVVRGVATGIAPGRTVGDDADHSFEYERVTVKVEATYWSRSGGATLTEVVLEQIARSGGRSVDYDGMSPIEEGDEVVLFLKQVPSDLNAPGDVTFTITSGVGRFDLTEAGSLSGIDGDAPVVNEIEAMSLDVLESVVAQIEE